MEEGEKENIWNSMMAAYKAVMVMVMVGLSQDQLIFGPWVVLTDGFPSILSLHVET